ncbi:sirohydrochlorin cobaltochelatase [Ruminococcus sp.]|uniref:sirohydrochlorin cobaltochelatase n=1 Tax=Ruminococcus sp. TaxID=41978 RepID=UPI0025FD631D|nr:sirohydrochlorin cobaltochelatase [Ruminococcus sp.]MCR4638108.1 sirohydrochlorin cobaltochelatase [Ruminococcus sp.]
MKKSIAFLMGLTVVASALTGCVGSKSSSESKESATSATEASTADDTTAEDTTAAESTTEPAEVDDEENYDTGDASLDNPRNQDEIGENELLVLSFGTSFNDSRRLTIGAIEESLEKAFPDYSVRRGFTANIIIDHVKCRDNEVIDDVKEALERAQKNGVKNLVVQPTHLMDGLEYNDIVNEIAGYSDAFEKVAIGKPLLTTDDDFKRVENAIVDWTKDYDDGKTAICFMGHGTEAESNGVYAKMQELLTVDGHTNYFIGTVEASPSVEDVLEKVKAGGYEKVVLEPLMVVAGDHANNDMAGDEEDSWKSVFEAEGYEVKCLLRGLGENEEIRKLYVEHAQAAVDSIK